MKLHSSHERKKHRYHSRIEFYSRAILQLAACRLVRHRWSKRTIIGERSIRISDAQYPCSQRNLFAPQRIRIACAVPPLVMPAHEQLRGPIGAGSRRLAFTDHWMAPQVDALVSRQLTVGLNVITLHRGLAEIVQQRRRVQRAAIVSREVKRMRDLVGDCRDALRMWVLVTLETIHGPGELGKSLAGFFVDQFNSL